MNRMTKPPTVSVVIPAYNAAWCVGKAIDSVLAQEYDAFEVIVVDDGSTDDTAAVLAGYHENIRVIRQINGGMSNARNAGIREATGEFIAFLDSDDWWMPGKLGRQVELLRAHPKIGFCSTAARVEDPEGRLLNVWQCQTWQGSFLVHLFQSNADVPGSCSAVMVRRALLQVTGGFDETLRGLEDPDLWIRLAAVSDYACIPEPMAVILRRPGSISRNLEVMRASAIHVMRKNRRLLPVSLQGGYWRVCMAGVHADYAKWQLREGHIGGALTDIAHMFRLAPLVRGRLGLGLLKAMVLGRAV